MEIKSKLLNYCKQQIDERIARSKQAIQFAQDAANTEEKSSAGDKYETGRAMAQRERDQAAVQLEETLKLKNIIDRINPSIQSKQVALGSLIITDKAKFYIAISLGLIQLDEVNYFVISKDSPIGKVLLNKTANENFHFNNEPHLILDIL